MRPAARVVPGGDFFVECVSPESGWWQVQDARNGDTVMGDAAVEAVFFADRVVESGVPADIVFVIWTGVEVVACQGSGLRCRIKINQFGG